MKNALWIVENDHLASTLTSLITGGTVIAIDGALIKWPAHTAKDPDFLSHPEFDPNDPALAGQIRDAARHSSSVFVSFVPDIQGLVFYTAIEQFLGPEVKCHPVSCGTWTKASLRQQSKTLPRNFKHWKSAAIFHSGFNSLFKQKISNSLSRLINEMNWLQAFTLSVLKQYQVRPTSHKSHFRIQTTLKGKNSHSVLVQLEQFKDNPIRIRSEQEAKAIIVALKEQTPIVATLDQSETLQPPDQLLTSTRLVHLAEGLWDWSPAHTLDVATSLYWAHAKKGGLISFPYSKRSSIPDTEHLEWRQLVFQDYGKEYLGPVCADTEKKILPWESDAIRPVQLEPLARKQKESLTSCQQQLFQLIREKTIAAHMNAAVRKNQSVKVKAGDFQLALTSYEYTQRGFLQVDHSMAVESSSIPILGLHEPLQWQDVYLDDYHQPGRFSKADLFAALIESGIHPQREVGGIIDILVEKGLIALGESGLFLTERGQVVVHHLEQFLGEFLTSLWAQDYYQNIRKMAFGKQRPTTVLPNFEKKLSALDNHSLLSKNRVCPVCNAPLLVGNRFVQCQNYPEQCDYVQQVDPSRPQCPQCGKLLVVRKGKFGRFYACPGYPECQHTEPFALEIKCPHPDCEGVIIERTGQSGKIFYGCSQYPGCDFILFEKPVDRSCSYCGYPVLVQKNTQSELVCPDCDKVHIPQETKVA